MCSFLDRDGEQLRIVASNDCFSAVRDCEGIVGRYCLRLIICSGDRPSFAIAIQQKAPESRFGRVARQGDCKKTGIFAESYWWIAAAFTPINRLKLSSRLRKADDISFPAIAIGHERHERSAPPVSQGASDKRRFYRSNAFAPLACGHPPLGAIHAIQSALRTRIQVDAEAVPWLQPWRGLVLGEHAT